MPTPLALSAAKAGTCDLGSVNQTPHRNPIGNPVGEPHRKLWVLRHNASSATILPFSSPPSSPSPGQLWVVPYLQPHLVQRWSCLPCLW